MARRPHPLLPFMRSTSPAAAPAQQPQTQGDSHALPNDHTGTIEESPPTLRNTASRLDAAAHDGATGQGTQVAPRDVDGDAGPATALQQLEPDPERISGDRDP